jgi:hypothetical protein
MYGGALRDSHHDAVWNEVDGGVCEVTCCTLLDEELYALSKLREDESKRDGKERRKKGRTEMKQIRVGRLCSILYSTELLVIVVQSRGTRIHVTRYFP